MEIGRYTNSARTYLISVAAGLLLAFSAALPALAFDSGSANFRNRASSIDQGGQTQTSSGYKNENAIGEMSLTTHTSTSYLMRSGLLPAYIYPGQITGLFASTGAAAGTISLQWTAPGNDGYAPNTAARAYKIKYSTTASQSPALSDANFDAAASVSGPPTPANQGATQNVVVTGLLPGTSYYFAFKASEADGLLGVLSAGTTAYATILPPDIATPTFTAVGTTTLTVHFTSGTQSGGYNPDGTQYAAQLSTASDFTGTVFSSHTYNLFAALGGLFPNTTYYARAAAVGPASTSAYTSLGSTSTLSDLTTGHLFAGVFKTSVTVNWTPLPTSPSSATAEGYSLEASTAADFSGTVFSSATPNVSLSTLTVSGLAGRTTYYFRVGSLNWNSVADYVSVGSTRTQSVLPEGCGTGYDVAKDGSMDFVTISAALGALSPSLTSNACVVIRDTQTYSEQVTVQGFTNNGYLLKIMSDPSFVSSAPVVNPPVGSTAAFQVANDSVTLQNITIITTNTVAYGVWASSAYVTLSSVNVDGGASLWDTGVALSSHSAVSYSSLTVRGDATGLDIRDATLSSVSHSTISVAVASVSGRALNLLRASSNTVTQSRITAVGNATAAYLDSGSTYNTISYSTVTAALLAARLVSASSNTVTRSYVQGGINNAVLLSAAVSNELSLSTFATSGGASVAAVNVSVNSIGNRLVDIVALSQLGQGVSFNSTARSNTLTRGMISGGSRGLVLDTSARANTISQSTITSPGSIALYLGATSSNTVSGSYVQGSTAVYISGSTGTVINASVLVATGAAGHGVWLDGGAVNLSLSSNTISGGSRGMGVYLAESNGGLINLSTNTVSGARIAVYVATQTAGTAVWITSNTILPNVDTSTETVGLYLNGLVSGATIQNNGIYFRTSGAASAANGIAARSASGLVIDHNRVSNPGMVTSGVYRGVVLAGVSGVTFEFNDLHAVAPTLNNVFLLRARSATSGLRLRNNIFSADFAAPVGSSATLVVDADSQTGFASDYNDFYSANSLNTALWGGAGYSLVGGWTAASGQDANSIASDPLFYDPSAGVEDFHPKSQKGRYAPASQSFVADSLTSPTIDAADPAESVGQEPAPNGSRANQGSYGQTDQASKSAPAPSNPLISAVYLSSITLAYGTVASDGYLAEASTAANFTGVVFSSATTNPSLAALSPQNLDPNTTYYLRVAAIYGANYTYAAQTPSSSTLASPAANAAVAGVFLTSITVNWTALPYSPPDASSKTAEGYVLQVSSRADFEPLWTTSATPNVGLSTLTASNLTGGVTYYFRVGTLNWNSAANYATAVSTLLPVQLGVYLSTHVLTLPGLTNLNSTVLISTSIVITNTGNVTETYKLRTTTATPGSPWYVGTTQGVDRFVAYAVMNSTAPSSNDFAGDDKLADPYSTSTVNAFSMGNENGVAVPAGQTRLLWFKLSTPVVTSTGATQQIQIDATAEASP